MNTDIRHNNSNDRSVNAENPWPGLASFTEHDREFFYGRDDEKDDLFRRVVRQNLTILFGQSGLGKSSLLRAGLFPKLRQAGYLPVPIRLDHSPNQLGLAAQVVMAADRAIASVGGKVQGLDSENPDSLWKYFHRRNFVPTDSSGEPLRLVLVFDQFEELFAAGQANEAARRRASDFINQFADLIENRVPLALEEQMDSQPELARLYDMQEQDHRYLICMREDYLPQLESLKRVIPSLSENRMRLTRMNGINALEAVLSPGYKLLTEDVATRIVRFVSGGKVRQLDGSILHDHDVLAGLEIEPPLLSLVCRELNSQRQATGLTQITIDLLAGNQKRILFDFYERCVSDMPAALREFIEDQLVTESGLRENVALERIQSYLQEHNVSPSSIDELIRRRLLQVEERLDVRRIELTHDVLTSVVKQSRDERRAREATQQAEHEAAQLLARARQQRRRLSLMVGGMAIILAIVSLFGFSSYRLYLISQERLLEAENQRKRAEAVKEVFDEATLPVTVENAPHIPGLGPVQEELAQLRIKSLQVLASKTPDDQTIPTELAEAFAVSGVIRTYVGSFEAAKSDLNKAIELYRQLYEKSPQSLELRRLELQSRSDLGFLLKEDIRFEAAGKIFESLIEELDSELEKNPDDVALQFELLLALSRQTATYPLQMPLTEKNRLIARMLELLDTLEQKKYRPGDVARLRTVVIYHQLQLKSADMSIEQRQSNFEVFKDLDDIALSYFPRSPMIRSYRIYDLNDRADLLSEQSQAANRINDRELALAEARSIYQGSPNAFRYGRLLINNLLTLAEEYNRAGREFEAEKLFDESQKLAEDLRLRFSDRGDAAYIWLDQRVRHSNFYFSGQQQEEALQDVNRYYQFVSDSLTTGRVLADRFPDHYSTQVEFAVLLGLAGSYHKEAEEYQEAYEHYHAAVDIFAQRLLSTREFDFPNTDIVNFLDYAASAAEAALKLGSDEQLSNLLTTLESLQFSIDDPSASYNYARTLQSVARWKSSKEDHSEVLRWSTKSIELQQKAHAAMPWHWYLTNDLGKNYRLLGDTQLAVGQYQAAIDAYRKFAQLIMAPLHSIDIAEFLDETKPSTEEQARALQTKIEALLKGAYKRFTVTADFNGISYPLPVYITNVPLPKHPLEDQARWLKEERGGIIPEETMEQFQRLQKIAADNNVSFVDLCMYALGEIKTNEAEPLDKETIFDDGLRYELEMPKLEAITVSDEDVDETGRDIFADQYAQYRELKAFYQENPTASEALTKLLSHTDQLGEKLLNARQFYDAQSILTTASSYHRINLERERFDPVRMGNFAKSLRNLASSCFNIGDYEQLFVIMLRRYELLKQIREMTPAEESLTAELADSALILGEVSEKIHTTTEAMDWYVQAAKLKHPRAYRKMARLLLRDTALSTALAEPERDLYLELYNQLPEIDRNNFQYLDNEIKRLRLADTQAGEFSPSLTPEERERQWNDSLSGIVEQRFRRFITEFERRLTKLRDDPQARRRREALIRGREKYLNEDYAGALPDYIEACEEDDTSANDFNRLGIIFGKNGKWNESIEAYKRAIEKRNFATFAVTSVLNLLEAFICNNQPQELIEYLETLTTNGFEVPVDDKRDIAFYHAFIAIAQIQTDVDPQLALEKMQEALEEAEITSTSWDWTEFDKWFQDSDLSDEKKSRIRSIVAKIRPQKEE